MRAERQGHELQTANWKFQHLRQNQTALGEHAHWKLCLPAPRPVVCNWANSSGKGSAHMENTEKNINKWIKIAESSAEFLCRYGARIRVGNDVSEWFPVNVGLRHSCVMSHGCLMYIWMVWFESWILRVGDAECDWWQVWDKPAVICRWYSTMAERWKVSWAIEDWG